ncbi:fungal-specific transcription factor domain-domain-containing protein [Protomyces lactucae-debilis]|uniref:Fungal-specific transcription factor domain-domain-containing protein n=1 Tax=Protomyces lactucae-debilis TaxID=2754530 RepID=A0A1Y2FND5_PROLT|nr:fungal-specific transcription factor domain-containing protein [Protomyces lactucae-debilis]ORY85439.1 fungal-specific transcription factor domain-domain-containing protein [Protomyces lactucae-debilis]
MDSDGSRSILMSPSTRDGTPLRGTGGPIRSEIPRSDPGADARSASRRYRLAQACDRCHKRKQKCDGQAQCGPCAAAGVECTLTDKVTQKTYPRSHLPELEERIYWLENMIHQARPGLNIRHIPTGTACGLDDAPSLAHLRRSRSPRSGAGSSSSAGGKGIAIPPPAELNKLAMPEGMEPKGNLFLDPSLESDEGFLPAGAGKAYGHYMRNTNLSQELAPIRPNISTPTMLFSKTIRAGAQIGHAGNDTYPPYEVAQLLVSNYFNHSHTQAPFLHHPSVQQRFTAFYATNFQDTQPTWCFIFLMVLAIGETTLERSEALNGRKVQREGNYHFFESAMELLEDAIDKTSITTVQCLLLMATYALQHPQALSIYRIVGYAMRLCIELSLHRTQSKKKSLTPLDREMRKRIFWSAYSLDRFASISLGRPCSIADENVSCELPLDIDDGMIRQNMVLSLPDGAVSEMTFSLAIFKLRRIAGRIIQQLYCVSNLSAHAQSALVDRFVSELEVWRLTIPSSSQLQEDESIVPSCYKSEDWFHLGYFHARLLLFRLLAPKGNPRDLRYCAEAALATVRLYAKLLERRLLNINWATLAMCFTAGVTLLWCVWLSPGNSLEPSISMAEVTKGIEHTETVLAALGGSWDTAQKCITLFRELCSSVVVSRPQDGGLEIGGNVLDLFDAFAMPGDEQRSEVFMNGNATDGQKEDGDLSHADIHGTGTEPTDMYTPFIESLAGADSVEGFENIGYLTGGFQAF